jgi:hypothetical protein
VGKVKSSSATAGTRSSFQSKRALKRFFVLFSKKQVKYEPLKEYYHKTLCHAGIARQYERYNKTGALQST